jgi:hypothetical protein
MNKHAATKIVMSLILIAIAGFSFEISGEVVQGSENKQYVQVNLKNGEAAVFEYRTFMEMNFAFQPVKTADTAKTGKTITFGENRVLFVEKDTCREYAISLDNLQEIELIGLTENKCTKKKDRLFKVYLLDLDKYEGFFQPGETNLDKPLAEQGIKGEVLNTTSTRTLNYEDIEKITFIAR